MHEGPAPGSSAGDSPSRGERARRRSVGDESSEPTSLSGLLEQGLLERTLRALAETIDCKRACVWMAVPGRPLPRVAASLAADDPRTRPQPADAGAWAAAAELAVPVVDLGDPSLPERLRELGRRSGLGAAGVLCSEAGETLALLLVGQPDLPGAVRPRTLAAIGQALDRLREPVQVAATAARLAELDEEAQRLDRLASLGGFVAEIVHEIRNPLVSVKTFLQLLPEREDDPEFTDEFRLVVMDEVLRMERLLDSVVQHARPVPESGAGESRANPASALESTLGLLMPRARERGVAISLEPAENLPDTEIDADALRQIVLNLAQNAVEASSRGGSVRLSARAEDPGEVVITVDDSGSGVAPEHRARIFEPFFSTRAERPGGLGLAICSRLVREAGGRISVEDAPGDEGGARFRVTLPRAQS